MLITDVFLCKKSNRKYQTVVFLVTKQVNRLGPATTGTFIYVQSFIFLLFWFYHIFFCLLGCSVDSITEAFVLKVLYFHIIKNCVEKNEVRLFLQLDFIQTFTCRSHTKFHLRYKRGHQLVKIVNVVALHNIIYIFGCRVFYQYYQLLLAFANAPRSKTCHLIVVDSKAILTLN